MIKAMIVDDKMHSIELLKWLIQQNVPDIKELRFATSVREAIPIISSFEPDILFLDIQMPHQSGFNLLTELEKWNFEVVFTTAYNEFAIQAIKFSALDYLLKPVDAGELVKAIERFKVKRIYAPAGEELYKNFIQNISSQHRKLALPGVTDIKYVNIDDIVRLQADRNYSRFFFIDGKEYLSAKTLKDYEEMLEGSGFVRVHRAHLVNSKYIREFEREGMLKLIDNSEVEVSRRKKDHLLRFMRGGAE